MIIPVNGVNTLADYIRRKEYLDKELRPLFCPSCKREKTFWRHGGYERRVLMGVEDVAVRINRFRCGKCGLVASCIFSFMGPYLRFASGVVAQGIQSYGEVEISYVKLASELTDLQSDSPAKPCSTQVFRWVERLARSAE